MARIRPWLSTVPLHFVGIRLPQAAILPLGPEYGPPSVHSPALNIRNTLSELTLNIPPWSFFLVPVAVEAEPILGTPGVIVNITDFLL